MDRKELKKRIESNAKWLKFHRHLDNWEGVNRYNYKLKAMYYRNQNVTT